MKMNIFCRVGIFTLVLTFGLLLMSCEDSVAVGSGGPDTAFNGRWVCICCQDLEFRLNNGSFEEFNHHVATARGTYTTNDIYFILDPTHLHGDFNFYGGDLAWIQFASRWYTRNEFKAEVENQLRIAGWLEWDIRDHLWDIEYLFWPRIYTYTLSGNILSFNYKSISQTFIRRN
jgi:hypothetical protein